MALAIDYAAPLGGVSLVAYLDAWSLAFNTSDHGAANPGGFNQTTTTGTQYATTGSANSYAFIAEGDLQYYWTPTLPVFDPNNHVLNGSIDTVEFGRDLFSSNGSSKPTTYSLDQFQASFSGLDLSSTGQAGDVHQTIWGLMGGNTDALEGILNDLLDDYGVSTTDTFDVVAAALAAGPLSTGSAELIGVPELADDLALAA